MHLISFTGHISMAHQSGLGWNIFASESYWTAFFSGQVCSPCNRMTPVQILVPTLKSCVSWSMFPHLSMPQFPQM